MNKLNATDPEAHKAIVELANQIFSLAEAVKRISTTLKLDEEVLDRIIDNLPNIETAETLEARAQAAEEKLTAQQEVWLEEFEVLLTRAQAAEADADRLAKAILDGDSAAGRAVKGSLRIMDALAQHAEAVRARGETA